MTKVPKNKESENKEKDAKVEKVDESKKDVKVKPKKEYTPVPHGTGGQFVDIGGGVKVSASEVETKD